jgi:RNA polymerase sigma factor (sigma-70 family)
MKLDRNAANESHDAGRAGHDIAALVREFAPLVGRLARRYEGRGALREDLEQEGRLALIKVARRVAERERMAYRLASLLPGMVRDAAARMRFQGGRVEFAQFASPEDDEPADGAGTEGGVPDGRSYRDFEDVELYAAIDALPDELDRKVVRAIADGKGLLEICKLAGVTHKTLRKRLNRLREALAPALRGDDRPAY